MKINSKQIIALLFYSPYFIAIFKNIDEIDSNLSLFAVLMNLLFLYFIFRSIWLLGTPLDNKIFFKGKTSEIISKGICPLCNRNEMSLNS